MGTTMTTSTTTMAITTSTTITITTTQPPTTPTRTTSTTKSATTTAATTTASATTARTPKCKWWCRRNRNPWSKKCSRWINCMACPSCERFRTEATSTTTGLVNDMRLTAYWNLEGCGPHGARNNFYWCDAQQLRCLKTVPVSVEICSTGSAALVDSRMSFEIDGCQYAWFAWYACEPADPENTRTRRLRGGSRWVRLGNPRLL